MRRAVESFIDSMTMYRLMLYGLYLITATAFVLSATNQLPFTIVELAPTLLILVTVSFAMSKLFSWTFSTAYNPESWKITAFILFFLIFPQTDLKGYLLVAAVAFIAVASKYILAIRGRHIFNPAAVAVVISSLLGLLGATWWVSTLVLLPVVTIVGLLIVWKVRHFLMVGVYLAISVILAVVIGYIAGRDIIDSLRVVVVSSPIIFAGTIMLIEPLTSPTSRRNQVIYALLVGTFGGLQVGWLSKPDVAILIGNIFAFLVGQRRAIKLEFVSATEITPSIYNVVLRPIRRIRFTAGQYIELTLPHKHSDDRGIRRTFSIASRPGVDTITLGLVTAEHSSSFKKALLALRPGQPLRATHIGGDFTMPRDIQRPLVMIAGGIGITPFRAMIDELISRGEKRDITLFYAVRQENLLVYGGLLKNAQQQFGMKIIPVISQPSSAWSGESGTLDIQTINRHVDNIYDPTFYISGPNAMAMSFRQQLRSAGVANSHIKTDYFSGY